MAQPAKATGEAIRAAIASIEARGEAITLQAVRSEIGGGSLATIQPIVKAWRAERDALTADVRFAEATAAAEPMPVPVRVAQALDTMRHILDQMGGLVGEAINAALADERRRARLELDAEREAGGRRVAEALERTRLAEAETDQVARDGRQIETERDEFVRQLEAVTGARDELAAAKAAVDTEIVGLQTERSSYIEQLTVERARVDHLHTELTEARSAQARAEERAALASRPAATSAGGDEASPPGRPDRARGAGRHRGEKPPEPQE